MTDKRSYTIRIKHSAEKEMDALPEKVFRRVTDAILRLETDPRPTGCKKLRGIDQYRLRVGPYRILYLVDDGEGLVHIVAVGHRREVYRDN